MMINHKSSNSCSICVSLEEKLDLLLLSTGIVMWSSPVVLTGSEFDQDSGNHVTS